LKLLYCILHFTVTLFLVRYPPANCAVYQEETQTKSILASLARFLFCLPLRITMCRGYGAVRAAAQLPMMPPPAPPWASPSDGTDERARAEVSAAQRSAGAGIAPFPRQTHRRA